MINAFSKWLIILISESVSISTKDLKQRTQHDILAILGFLKTALSVFRAGRGL